MSASLPPLGLVGLAQSGKDTTADMLAPYGYRRVAFADALKRAAIEVDPIVKVAGGTYSAPVIHRLSDVLEMAGGDLDFVKNEHPEVRRFLQSYGVTIRDIDPDFWVNAAMKEAPGRRSTPIGDALLGPPPPVVFTDVRFDNEVDAVRNIGGLTVLIKRQGAGLEGSAGEHPSEALARTIEPDVVLHNDGTLDDLRHGVEALVNALPDLPLP